MGTDHALLSKALFSKTLERVLGLLFGNPDRSFYANEIVRSPFPAGRWRRCAGGRA